MGTRRVTVSLVAVATSGVLALAAACGSFSGASPAAATDAAADADPTSLVDGGGGDAPDSAAGFCSGAPGLFFCADFDESEPMAFVFGTPVTITLLGGGALTTPPHSPPAAFWSTGQSPRVGASGTKAVTFMHAKLRLRFDTVKIGAGGFLRLGVAPQCYVDLKQEQAPDRLGIDTHCAYGSANLWYDHKDLLSSLPVAGVWYDVELTADFGNATAFARIDGETVTMGLNAAATLGGLPSVEVGPDFAAERVGIDDVVVDVK